MKVESISFIGAGNVATQLAINMREKGFDIVDVLSKTLLNSKALAEKVNATPKTVIEKLSAVDLLIIAVSDDAISEIAKSIPPKFGIVAHTSGSVDMTPLENVEGSHGILYPLQTFKKEHNTDLSDVPFCIEGDSAETEEKLVCTAKMISNNVHLIDSQKRRKLHIAAVFACNFSNHMFTIAEELLAEEDLKLDLLIPLINQTVGKIRHSSPAKNQTGPAKRKDRGIIEKHIDMLHEHPYFQNIYKSVSDSIVHL